MIKILLIGCGQLGSRYVQGFFNSKYQIVIQILEPNELSRINLMKILNNTALDNKEYFFINSIDEAYDILDLVVISTSSHVRYLIFEELIKKRQVKKVILEKILFQKKEEYYQAFDLIHKNNIQCWVNHTRRMFPFYEKIRTYLSNSSNISFCVSGGNWGMGCNALHFLDCIQFLSQKKIQYIDFSNIEKVLYPSKRDGFYEINGVLSGISDGVYFSLISRKTFSPHIFYIDSDDISIIVDEGKNSYYIKEKKSNWNEFIFIQEKICYYQSELSSILLDDIVNDICRLPLYKESMELHLKFIEPFIRHINSFSSKQYDYCPIT
ncbi:TPA: hypothetical protein SFY16_000692 [Campylobacter jejuni]|uniref:dehydrogenase n=1 Tax=Campylobacter jejuni TaxID=197 RepID=UPI000F808DD4|nr:dehydrogenase [Campylobacter jejuni]RTJ88861.1 dehydrogenase [Campylobacter jejuni]HED7286585.1 hypothetical protein [Campylobacter jejuni]HEG2562074.1 hypothetical protein [Campylobacter jejuni]HEG7986094.1 hypothetical protein [Campylobacter jejuni]HEG8042550.1 hypothetical protein [Campylobacter jejuni]